MAKALVTSDLEQRNMKDLREASQVVAITLCLIAVTWAGLLWVSGQAREAEIERAYAHAEQRAKIFSEQVTHTIKSIDALISFAVYEINRDPTLDSLSRLARSGAFSMDPLVQIALVDLDGRTLATQAGPVPSRTDVSDREHVRVHLDGQVEGLFIGKPVLGRVSGKWSIQLSRKITSPDGETSGVIVASLDPYYFQQFWSEAAQDANEVVLLVGTDGRVRARSSKLGWALGSHLDRHDLLQAAAASASGRIRDFSPDGVERIGYFARTPGFPLIAFSGVPVTEVAERYDARQATYAAMGIAVTAILIVFGAWLVWFAMRLRKEERESRKARQRLADAVAVLPEGFMLFDADDRLILANEAIGKIYARIADRIKPGVTFEEIIRAGLDRNQWVPTEELGVDEWIRTRVSKHRKCGGPIEIHTQDGKWIRVVERPTAEGGVVGIRLDVTHVKERETSLLAVQAQLAHQADHMRKLADKARQADHAKSSFLAAMSHEIRTPLNAVLGFIGLIKKTPLNMEQEEYVRTIDSSAAHLRQIVNDLLDFSQLQAGRLSIENAPFNLMDVLRELEKVTSVLVRGRPIAVTLSCEADVPCDVRGDRARLYQVLLNICGNAAKFTSAGAIDIRVSAPARCGGGRVYRFEVSDTGPGIGEAAISRLFTPFEQGEVSGSLRAAGTGLGLAISKSLADLMGGWIEVTSAPGEGSTFTAVIPLVPAAQADRPAPSSTPDSEGGLKKLRILVADDARSSRDLMRILLQKNGHTVEEAEDGVSAVEAATSRPFDLILLDLQMPRLGGLEAARAISARLEGARKPVIAALTAQVQPSDQQAAREAGMHHFLTKPLHEDQLNHVMHAAQHREPAPATG